MVEIAGIPRALRWLPVWRRNLLVWRKLAVPSLLGNFGEPLLYLLALGYGLGALVGEVEGMPYVVWLASGIVCSSCMVSASFEAMYSAYTRMSPQRTWDAMISTPLDIGDVVLGEVVWAATKGLVSATAILLVGAGLGAVQGGWATVLALPAVFLAGLAFASMAMVVTALSRSYDFFLYYSTLCITPMLLLGGVFFPVGQMPEAVQALSLALPLTHAVALVRPLVIGEPVSSAVVHLSVITAYGLGALLLARHLLEKRLRS
jgi:lipooligosaccharide transport system permease protein